jgi:hypothetical protein
MHSLLLKACSKKNKEKLLKFCKKWNYFAEDKEHTKKETVNVLTPDFAAKRRLQSLLNCDTRVLENLHKKLRKGNLSGYADFIRW